MMTQPKRAAEHAFRLSGRVYGVPFVRLLARGENLVGTLASCGIQLPFRGVSRRHARLRWEPGKLSIEDLASRNGTFVNGERVRTAPVRPADELRFGPVVLRLEAIDPGDAVLGLAVVPAGDAQGAAGEPETEWVAPPAPPGDGAGGQAALEALRVVEGFLDRTAMAGRPDLAGALGLVCRHAGAPAGALLEQEADHEPRVLAAWGDLREISRRIDLGELMGALAVSSSREVADGGPDRLAEVLPSAMACSIARLGRRLVAAVLAEGAHTLAAGEATLLLAILLRLIARLDRRSPPPAASGRAARDRAAVPAAPGFLRCVSPAMAATYAEVGRVCHGDFPVLVVGETGVGKEHVVRLLHDLSARREGPLVAVNCAAIPADLLEAELFGVARGAATGVQERKGRFQLAHGGTLLLDEIGEMPAALQAKLLRALEEGAVHPLGGAPVATDIRVVSATNADLAGQAAAGRFRADLYFRLAGYVLAVPPLRRRREDITLFIQHLLGDFAREAGVWIPGVSLRALERLVSYDWPGNIRQLENELRRLVYVCPDGQPIDSRMLPEALAEPSRPSAAPAGGLDPGGRAAESGEEGAELGAAGEASSSLRLAAHQEALERRLILAALQRSRGNQRSAARLLGLSRNGLGNRMRRLGIPRRSELAPGGPGGPVMQGAAPHGAAGSTAAPRGAAGPTVGAHGAAGPGAGARGPSSQTAAQEGSSRQSAAAGEPDAGAW